MRAFQLVAWQSPPELRDAEGRLCVELFSGNTSTSVRNRRIFPVPAVSGERRFTEHNGHLSLGGSNRS